MTTLFIKAKDTSRMNVPIQLTALPKNIISNPATKTRDEFPKNFPSKNMNKKKEKSVFLDGSS